MNARMSISNAALAMFLAAAPRAPAQTPVDQIRLPGAGLDLSTRNEVAAAVRRAGDWLAARQSPQGSWGVSNTVKITSAALTALCAPRRQRHSDSRARAALWLKDTAARQIADIETHALRLLALSLTLPDSPARSNLFADLAARAESSADINAAAPADRDLWRMATAAAGLRSSAADLNTDTAAGLRRTAADWPPFPCAAREIWRSAKLINAAGGGVITRGGDRIDWRAETAVFLLGSQRRDPSGGAYWDAPDPDRRVLETAWSILTLSEL
ncbi:MAG: hypothetical protein PHE10_10535 [Kiritimatiellae bacterium]|nr:hypothetical protein [Kiritimatiellia bacterium]MDD4026070.1 hypothetical protein [Kiritimatiellia bacterium]